MAKIEQKIIIKNAQKQDAEQLFNLQQTTLIEPDNLLQDPDKWEHNLPAEKTKINNSLKQGNPIYLTATSDNQIIGFLTLTGGDYQKNQHSGTLEMFVRQEWRGQGVGKLLLQALIDQIKKHPIIKRIELEVWSNNEPALKLYKKFGFKVEGRKKNSYLIKNKYIDAIIMAKLINNKK